MFPWLEVHCSALCEAGFLVEVAIAACSTASRTGRSRRSWCKCWRPAWRNAPACSCPCPPSARSLQASPSSTAHCPQCCLFANSLCAARCACSSHESAPAGYFDAPGADVAPLKSLQSAPPILPDITLVFCCIEKLKDMKVGAPHPIQLWISLPQGMRTCKQSVKYAC